ncbi:unnamed protein product [Schistocephalus solidus]|uniref:ADP,ATP carrier protein n=1 Tax=Schistocephalus solidus TaxID=70667 RepID=A0A183TGM7_SCHSO|nr:unnamed protein product [Schistocephalus solidus]
MGSSTKNAPVAVAGSVTPPVTLAAVQAATLSRRAVDRRRYLAGFIAGCVSRTCTAPIDRLKVLRQTAVPEIAGRNMFHCFKVMIADGGLRALWRGNGVNVLKNGPETALRFGFHGRLKDILFPGAKDLQPSQRFLVASLAGAGSLTMTYPLEVMKTRMALRRTGDPKSIVRCLQTIFQQGGFRSFYRGYTISMLSYVPYSGLELSFYEVTPRLTLRHPTPGLGLLKMVYAVELDGIHVLFFSLDKLFSKLDAINGFQAFETIPWAICCSILDINSVKYTNIISKKVCVFVQRLYI